MAPSPVIAMPSPNEVAEVVVTNRQLPMMTRDALNALHTSNNPESIFSRSRQLVRIVRDEKKARPAVVEFTKHSLRGVLSRAAKFTAITDRGRRATVPPEVLVQDILSLSPEDVLDVCGRAFPALSAVTEVPYLKPDGTVVSSRGYDESTEIFYEPAMGVSFPSIPHEPSSTDVSAAVSVIEDVIGEFPFDCEASKTNLIALLLTPVVRSAIRGCVPLTIIDATAPGTGKSLLAEIVSLTFTGCPASMQTAPESDEEWRKKITAGLRSGSTLMFFDNVSKPVESASLAAALTSERWSDRDLGLSRLIEVDQRAVWIVTGNNVTFGRSEFRRRSYRIRLDAKVADPAQRSGFKHPNLKQYVHDHRGRIIAALLTIARAWFACGKPPARTPVMGSFENWSVTLGGILEFANLKGFLANAKDMSDDSDLEANEWESFLLALSDRFGQKTFKSSDVAKAIRKGDEKLADALPSELALHLRDDAKLRLYLGRAFSSHRQRRFGRDGRHLARSGDSGNSALWRVALS